MTYAELRSILLLRVGIQTDSKIELPNGPMAHVAFGPFFVFGGRQVNDQVIERRRFHTISEAARELRVTTRTIRRWSKDGTLRVIRVGSRYVRIPDTEIDRLYQSGT